jgi:peptidoglycan/LPS O-acetylase OafA/YrhL
MPTQYGRLLPALLLTVPLGWLAAATYPTALTSRPYWVGMVSALAYVSNWVQLWDSSTLRTLAHTWSLAVEEQFYLLWPVGLMVLLRRRQRELATVLTVVTVLVVASLSYMAVAERLDPTADLYVSTLSRAGELLLGAGLSVLWRHRRLPRLLTGPVAVAAALLVLACLTPVTNERTPWLYGWGGLYLAAGAAVVLIAAVLERPTGTVAGLLATRPMRFTGRISYGMYLFNYPLSFLLSSATLGVGRGMSQLLVLTATWSLAALSYLLIERPLLGRPRGSLRVGYARALPAP